MEKNEIESYVKAGKIAVEIKKYAREIISRGVKLIDIADKIDKKINELGAVPAFPLGLSLNEIAAHFTPEHGDETVAEGILKVDIGVAVDGYIADTAFSVDLTDDERFKDMIKLNEKILVKVRETIKPGIEVCKIGDIVQDEVEEWNKEGGAKFTIIRSLSGHQIARNLVHAGMTVLNIRNENKTSLKEMAIAVESFVTTGVGEVYEGADGGIYIIKSDKKVRDRDSRDVLKFIKENYGTRPFCRRWLDNAGFNKLGFILSNLVKQRILYHHPILIEKSKAPVSQVENTFVFNGNEVITTTLED
tara:strand:- start:73 stop:984 length:912 start_codon:yes stop_codon:yes gene_type:complete